MCSPSTRGIWIDLLCSLHDARISQLTATPEQFARICRCDTGSMLAGLLELQSTGAANVSEREGSFTVICRRMKKAEDLSLKRAEAGSKGGAKSRQTENRPENEDGNGLERVREFAKIEGISQSDADWFFWKGEGNGWTNGGKPILDWKATFRSWSRAKYLPSQRNGPKLGFQKQKEKAPVYPKMTESRQVSDEEFEKHRKIAREETEKLRLSRREQSNTAQP